MPPISLEPVAAAGAGPVVAAPPSAIAPRPFRMLLDEAVPWARRHLRTIYLPVALAVAVVTAGMTAAQVRLQMPSVLRAADPQESLVRLYTTLAAMGPFLLVIGLLHGSLTVAAVDAVAGRAAGIRRALAFMVRPRVLATLALMFLCVLGSFVCGCGFLVFYVWPLLAMSLPAMAAEGVTGTAALRRSAQLTRHNPRRRFVTSPIVKILALSSVTALLAYLASLVFQLPIQVIQGLVVLRRAASGEDLPGWYPVVAWLQVPMTFLASLVSTAVSLYASFATALLFVDLRARREGDDLRRAIAEMTGAAAGPVPPRDASA